MIRPELNGIGSRFHAVHGQRIELTVRRTGCDEPNRVRMIVDGADAINLGQDLRIDIGTIRGRSGA